MSTIEIISHCWNGHLTIYAALLRAQGRSFIDFSTHKCSVVWSVCYHKSDELVSAVLDGLEVELEFSRVRINRVPLELDNLFRRAIGRNKVALASTADCVWFCDCDYLFFGNCLDSAVAACDEQPDSILYPKQVLVTSHPHGDLLVKKMRDAAQNLTADDFKMFYPRSEIRAIGGIQIVCGDLARAKGYLNNSKWTVPLEDTSLGWMNPRCDIRYRRYIGTQLPAAVSGACRIRHSIRSYDGIIR